MSPLEVLTPALLLWVVVVVAVAAWVYGVLGVGLPLIATPLLALVMPLQDAVIVLVVPSADLNRARRVISARPPLDHLTPDT